MFYRIDCLTCAYNPITSNIPSQDMHIFDLLEM